MFRRDAMFRQSLIQVFKGLAEFHGYVPDTTALKTGADKTATISPVKQAQVSASNQATTVSCC